MAVNLVAIVTINRLMLYRGQPSTSIGTVFTSTTDTKIASMVFCNTTTASATITVSVVNSGGTAGVANRVVSGLVIAANSTIVIDSSIYLTSGDFIAAVQGTASAITASISGETYA